MQRLCSVKGMPWREKTLSAVQRREAEKCMQRFEGMPHVSIFDDNADMYAQEIWDLSYDSEEGVFPEKLWTVEELRDIVRGRFFDEIMSISPNERVLMKDAAIDIRGRRQIEFNSELFAAESIVRRMWGKIVFNDRTQHFDLLIPEVLCTQMVECIIGKEISKFNEISQNAVSLVHSMLYAMGVAEMGDVESRLEEINFDIDTAKIKQYPQLLRRLFMAECGYIKMADGKIMLFHDGATDTELMMRNYKSIVSENYDIDYDMLVSAQGDAFDSEIPLLQRMLITIAGGARPEIELEEAVNDLRFLVKQGVAYDEMVEVLKSMLVSLPTRDMLSALKDVCSKTPRWIGMSSEVRQ